MFTLRKKCMKINSKRKRGITHSVLLFIAAMLLLSVNEKKVQAYVISGFYQYEWNDTGITIIKYTGGESEITIPSELDGNKVTKLGNNAFKNNQYLTKAIIPNTIIDIGEEAFANCTNMRDVVIPFSVKKIQRKAFSACSSLTKVVLPNSLRIISGLVFEGCRQLLELHIPNSVISIGYESTWGSIIAKCPNTIIYGYAGSVAEAYTMELGIPFILLPAVPVTGFTFEPKEISLYAGEEYSISYKTIPETTTDNIVFKSSNTDIVSVSDIGLITAKSAGSINIFVEASSGVKETLTVNVKSEPQSVSFSTWYVTLTVGQSYTQKALIDYSKKTDIPIIYTSSDSSIAKISDTGKVTTLKTGSVTIRAEIFNGKYATYWIDVWKQPSSVSLNKKSLTLSVKRGYQLIPSIPADSYTAKYTFKSSNPAIASVDKSGKVVAKKNGKTVITVTTANGKKANCTVTVK